MHRKPKRSGMKPKVVKEDLGSDDDYAYNNDKDSLYNDNASVASQLSDISIPNKDEAFLGVGRESPVEDQEELYEEKIKEALDLATQKSANGRVQALEGLCRAFSKKYLPDFVEGRYMTITDVAERALKKGKGVEKAAGASLVSSLCIQLGPSDSSEEVYKTLKSTLITALNDNSNSAKARASIAYALGMTCFLAGGEMAEVVNIMAVMENIFMSPKKGEVNGEAFELHTAAVSAWSLLLTMLPSDRSYSMLESHMDNLGLLLKSPDLDLRIAVGEAIAILFESAVEHDEDSTFESVESLCDELRDLATDSNKRRSKKDRKEQRSSFRDILKTIEEGRDYREKISINSREILYIDSWSTKKQYDSICKVLLSGVNLHMTENELVRDIFGLGAPLPILSSHNTNKPSKYEKQLVNSQAFKHRTKTRGKERDKRSAIF